MISFVLQNWTERLREAVTSFLSHLHCFSLLLSSLDQLSWGAKEAAGVLDFVLTCRARPWVPNAIPSRLKTMKVFPLTSGSTKSSSKFLQLMEIVIYSDPILQFAKYRHFSSASIKWDFLHVQNPVLWVTFSGVQVETNPVLQKLK